MISTTVLGPLMNGQYPAIHPTGVREYLLWGVVVGVGTGSTALVLSATVVNRWFSRQRGLALGLLGAANSTGRLVFLPLLATCARGPGAHPPPEAPLVPFGVALRQGDLWRPWLTFAICGAKTNGLIGTHLIPHAIDQGLTAVSPRRMPQDAEELGLCQ